MEESYPPRIEDLQAAFLALHPDYRFSAVGFGHDQRGWDPCPLEVAGKNVWGGMSAGGVCDQKGARHSEWCQYIQNRGLELAKEAGIEMPPQHQMSIDPFRYLTLTIWQYRDLCRNPALTPEARLGRELSRAAAIRTEKERQERVEQQRLAAVAWAAKEEEARKEKARLFHLEFAAAKERLDAAVAAPAVSRPPTAEETALMQRHAIHMAGAGAAAPRKAIPKKIRGEAWKAHFGSSTEGSCYCCRKELDIFDDWHAGHIVPSARGGPDTADNLRPLCGSCNLAMGTEHMDAFKARCYPA
jgi:hypothetical protein